MRRATPTRSCYGLCPVHLFSRTAFSRAPLSCVSARGGASWGRFRTKPLWEGAPCGVTATKHAYHSQRTETCPSARTSRASSVSRSKNSRSSRAFSNLIVSRTSVGSGSGTSYGAALSCSKAPETFSIFKVNFRRMRNNFSKQLNTHVSRFLWPTMNFILGFRA